MYSLTKEIMNCVITLEYIKTKSHSYTSLHSYELSLFLKGIMFVTVEQLNPNEHCYIR